MTKPRMAIMTRPAPAAIPPMAAAARPVLASSSLLDEVDDLEDVDFGPELPDSVAAALVPVPLASEKGSLVGARVEPMAVI